MHRTVLLTSTSLALLVLIGLLGTEPPYRLPALLVQDKAATMRESTSPPGRNLLAARYHLRNRTKAFFDRAAEGQVQNDCSQSAALLDARGRGVISTQGALLDLNRTSNVPASTVLR